MRHAKLFGLALVAVFALSASAASIASAALPEFDGPFPKTFTGLGPAGKLETVGGSTVNCNDVHVNGRILSAKIDLAKLTFLGCTATAGGATAPCGTILTNPLLSLLGYIKASTKLVGILLEPEETLFATFTCTAGIIKIKVEVKGTIGGEITPVNSSVHTFKLSFHQAGGKQEINQFEGEGLMKLESKVLGGFEESGVSQEAELELSGVEKGIILA